jgi:hypothetical protein
LSRGVMAAMLTQMPRRHVLLLVVCAVSALAAAGAPVSRADLGKTPIAAAFARTDRWLHHEAGGYGGAATYKLGTCKLLHRRPWLAYTCTGALFGRGLVCHITVTLAVRKVARDSYNAISVKSYADGPLNAPC